jgi:hypothetical protein
MGRAMHMGVLIVSLNRERVGVGVYLLTLVIGGNLLNELINDAKAVYGVVTTIIAVLA